MLKLIVILIIIYLLWKLYRNEPWMNYNLPNGFYNYYQNILYNGLSPFHNKDTLYNAGIWQFPNYSTNQVFGNIYADHYAYHNYLANRKLSGYQDRYSVISTPPLTMGNDD